MTLQLLLLFSLWQHNQENIMCFVTVLKSKRVFTLWCNLSILLIWAHKNLFFTWQGIFYSTEEPQYQGYQIQGSIDTWMPPAKQEKSVTMWKLLWHLENALKKVSSSANSMFVVSRWGRTSMADCLMSHVMLPTVQWPYAMYGPAPLWRHKARWACHRPEMTENARMRWHVIVHVW